MTTDPTVPLSDAPGAEALRDATFARHEVRLVVRRRRPLFANPDARVRCETVARASAETLGCRVERCEVGFWDLILRAEAPTSVSSETLAEALRADVGAAFSAEFVWDASAGG